MRGPDRNARRAVPAPGRPVTTSDYLPGLAADAVLPSAVRAAPVVVLVAGGGWHSSDRRGLLPLARALASANQR